MESLCNTESCVQVDLLLVCLRASLKKFTGTPGQLSFPFFPQTTGTYTTEAITDILNILVTASYLKATGVTANLVAGRNVPFPGEPAGSNLTLRSSQADAAIEQYHIDFWTSVCGTPIITTFTQGPANATAFEARNDVHIAMYMAAVREFAELGQPMLAKWAFQTGAALVEARLDSRWSQALNGNPAGNPPNNKAFQTDLLLYVRDALDLFKALGQIGGSGQTLPYPGRDAVLAAAGPMAGSLLQKTPNNVRASVVFTDTVSLIGERA